MLENPGIIASIVFGISAIILAIVARKLKKTQAGKVDGKT